MKNYCKKLSKIMFIVILFCLIADSFQQTCDQDGLEKFVDAASSFELGASLVKDNSRIRFPENKAQWKTWCRKNRQSLDYIDKYNKQCNRNLVKDFVSIYSFGGKRTWKLYCKAGTKQANQIIDSGSCFNRILNHTSNCLYLLTNEILGAQNHPDDRKKIPHFCCSMNRYDQCIEKGMIRHRYCQENRYEYIKNYLTSKISDLLELFCGDYKHNSEKCSKLGNPPKKRKSQITPKSPTIPIIDLLESIKEV